MNISRITELSTHNYTKEEIENNIKYKKYIPKFCGRFDFYCAYVGRHDQPNIYDKRACVIAKDMGDSVKVLKITSKHPNLKNVDFYKIKNHDGLNFEGPSYIRLEKKLYIIKKKWLTIYDENLAEEDTSSLAEILKKKYNIEE